jgi:hypothetical protein
MRSCLRSIAILSLFAASFLLVGTRTAGAASATATINSISATGVDGVLGTVTFMDSAQGLGGVDSPDGGVHLALRRLKSKCLKSSRPLIGSLRSLQDGAYIAGYCESLCNRLLSTRGCIRIAVD